MVAGVSTEYLLTKTFDLCLGKRLAFHQDLNLFVKVRDVDGGGGGGFGRHGRIGTSFV